MPYAEATAISVHLPEQDRNYSHHVLITEGFVIEQIFDKMELSVTVKAGIYGFTSKEARDRFISQANRSSELEIAFIAVV